MLGSCPGVPGFDVCAGARFDELVDTRAVDKRPGPRHFGNRDGMAFRRLDIFVEVTFPTDFPSFPGEKQVRGR